MNLKTKSVAGLLIEDKTKHTVNFLIVGRSTAGTFWDGSGWETSSCGNSGAGLGGCCSVQSVD